MLLPNCRCCPQNHGGIHHPHCPTVVEPMLLNDTQLQAESNYIGNFVSQHITAEILSRKDQDGNPIFPLLSQHIRA